MRNLDILAAENGEHIRVLLCGEEQCYVVSCQHFRMPYPVASDLLAELQPVPAETYSVFVLDEDITNRQREGRNRKLDLIAPLLEDACIYDKSHRNEVVRQIAAEHGIARRTVLQYLWRYWVCNTIIIPVRMSLIPAYHRAEKCQSAKPVLGATLQTAKSRTMAVVTQATTAIIFSIKFKLCTSNIKTACYRMTK